jgi:diguanylate cyclase (GGDEF)-like protein
MPGLANRLTSLTASAAMPTQDSSPAGTNAGDFDQYAASLSAVLDVPRAVRNGAEITSVLSTIARAVSEALGFETVVMNVYRPEWDDFHVVAVHGSDSVRAALLGSVDDWGTWKPLLHPQFRRAGAYFIPHEAFDWSQHPGARFVPEGDPLVDGPTGWHPEDELFVPLERSDGQIVGIMSFGDPVDGLRPADQKLALAVTLATQAALALETAEEHARLQRHQRGLEELLHVSSQLPQTTSIESMLNSVCAAIRDALDFDKVLIQLVDETDTTLRCVAAAGWEEADEAVTTTLDLHAISRLFDSQFEIAGCYLVPALEAEARTGANQVVYESALNGKGPFGWNHHWLLVPLYDPEGSVRGLIWADEPRSRLLPTENVLQALRIFGNHAMGTLAVATQLNETKFLADHDSLTRLLNRRALMHELERGSDRDPAGAEQLALVFLDLDNFKEINDEFGHTVGDQVLERIGLQLAELVRSGDQAFRVGGDEFALLLRGSGEDEARQIVTRVVAALEASIDPLLRRVRASFGIATSNAGLEPEELLRVADEAMYQAKRAGTGVEVAA